MILVSPTLNGNHHGTTVRSLLKENHIFHVAGWISVAIGVVVIVTLLVVHVTVSRVVAARGSGTQPDIRRFSNRYDRLRSDLRATERSREQLTRIRPAPSELVSLIERLEATAAAQHVRVTVNAFPAETDPAGQPYAVPVLRYGLVLEGSLDGVTGLLERMAQDPFLVRIETAELTSPTTEDLDRATTARITVAVAVRARTP